MRILSYIFHRCSSDLLHSSSFRWKLQLKRDPDSAYDLRVPEVFSNSASYLKEDSEAVQEIPTPQSASPYIPSEMSCEERKQLLLDDSRCKVAEPNRVLCATCSEWVTLHDTLRYDLSNWIEHKELCKLEGRSKLVVKPRISRKPRTTMTPPSQDLEL